MEPIIYWPPVFNKEDIKHNMHSSSLYRGHLDTSNGSAYSQDAFRTFLNSLVRRVFSFIYQFQALKHRLPTPRWYDQHFTHAHSDITRAVAAMDS